MKKIILLLMILFVQVSFAQGSFLVRDSIEYHRTQILYHNQRLAELEAGNESNTDQRITDLENNQVAIGQSLEAIYDSIAALRSSIGFLVPTFPDAINYFNASQDGSNIKFKWTKYDLSVVADSFEVVWSNQDPLIAGDPLVSSDFTTDTFYTIVAPPKNTIYWGWAKAWKNGTPSASSPSDSAFVYEGSEGVGGGDYTDTLYVSASATGTGTGQTVGSPYTIYQALNSANAGNLILAAAGTYNLNAQDLDITRAGTYANRIELRGVIDPADSGGFSYSTNSTTFIVTTDQNNDSAPMFEVFAPYNTIKDVLMINAATGQAGWGRIDADAYCTILDGIEFKQTTTTTGSIHSWRVYADSITIRNSFFNRGSRCIIWFETNGDGDNTIKTALVENNVFTGAFDHGAIQFMPNTATVNPNWLEDITVRGNTFIDNPYAWNLHFRYFKRANVYNNLFIRSGGIYTNDRHYPNDTDSLNSEGSLFVYNTCVGADGADIVGINRQMNGIIFANNLQVFDATPSYIWRFTNLAVGEEPFNRGHYFDYNFFDITGSTSISSVISSWNTASDTYVNVNWTAWKALGFDNHTVIDTAPTFAVGTDNYRPLSGASPQVGIGMPITTANGFRINITTDKDGNPRDATNPTAGAFEE